MFPRAQRLHTSKSILLVLRKGNRKITGCFCCYFLPKPGSVGKVTVIVGTKVSKKSVERNLLKRQTRAILRGLGLPEGSLVVRVQPAALGKTYNQLESELNVCLRNIQSSHS